MCCRVEWVNCCVIGPSVQCLGGLVVHCLTGQAEEVLCYAKQLTVNFVSPGSSAACKVGRCLQQNRC